MRKLVLLIYGAMLVCAAGTAFGQGKPVTLDSLYEFRGRAVDVPGRAYWAPDGKTFAYILGKKLMLFDVAAKQSREITSLSTMEEAAIEPAKPVRAEWEDRGVDEAELQWASSGKNLLYLSNGDLFWIDVPSGKWRHGTKTATAERDPKVSPDGKRIAFQRDWDLYTLDVASGKETRLTANGSDTLRNGGVDWVYPEELELGTAFWWAPDSKSIAYLQFDVSTEPLYPHEDLRGTRAIYEPQRYPQAGDPNAAVRLGVVNAGGGQTKWLDVGDTVRDHLIARAGWSADARNVYVVRTNRIQNQLEILLFDAVSGKSTEVYRETDPYWINVEGDPYFLKNGREFLWTSERDGFRHIYLLSTDGRERKQLTKGPWEVTSIAGVDESGGRVYYVSSEASALERQLYSVALDGSGEKRLTAGSGTHRVSMAPGCGYYLDGFSSLTSPPETVIRSIDGAQIAVFRPSDRSAQEQFTLLPTEIVSFKGPDGTLLYANLTKPAGFDPNKKYPAIVDVYGGPHVQSVRNAWPGTTIDQVFAHKGYVVWEMDNRGTSGRGHAFETPVFRNLGKIELIDQRAGIEHLVSMGFVDSDRIGVNGWSYGGFMTLNLLMNATELFRAGFAGAPVTNWLNYDSIYTERYMGNPKDNPEGYVATALGPHARDLRGSLMIVHNLEDDNVLFENTLQLLDALEAANKQFEFILYPGKTHGVTVQTSRQMESAMIDFFNRNLDPAATR